MGVEYLVERGLELPIICVPCWREAFLRVFALTQKRVHLLLFLFGKEFDLFDDLRCCHAFKLGVVFVPSKPRPLSESPFVSSVGETCL